LKESRLLFKLN
ncbi:hypothetical protein V495_08018, partial [Pseudogymnoascus sp. VKM F-4514 (FW-929)]